MVINNNFKKGVLAAMLLASPFVSAKTDYPASDFQPKVLYSDSDYKHSGAAPAAAKKAKQTGFDANYPAATFEPKVLYSDSNYEHKKDVVSAPKKHKMSATSVMVEQNAAVNEAEESDQTMLIGLIALAVVGVFFIRKKSAAAPKAKAAPRRPARTVSVNVSEEGGLTGVAKYLAGKEISTTGVAKYLASKQETPVTGVAKYMAKQVIAARKAAAENITGVEKYLRDKG